MRKVKIGLLGTGLDTYWNQFEGLHDALLAYQEKICSKMEVVNDVEVVNVGLVDNAQKSIEAADKLVSEGVDIVFFIYVNLLLVIDGFAYSSES